MRGHGQGSGCGLHHAGPGVAGVPEESGGLDPSLQEHALREA